MLRCKDVAQILGSGEHLTLRKRFALRIHLSMCKSCSAYASQLKMIKNGFSILFRAKTDIDNEVVENLEEKILDSLRCRENQ